VHAVTNGVHAGTWLSNSFQELFDKQIPAWRHDNNYFRSVYGIDPMLIEQAHAAGKQRLFETVKARTGIELDPNMLTLGFARRVATYKRATLLFCDIERLKQIADRVGGLQVIYAGKAHPADNAGKALIREVFAAAKQLEGSKLRIVYLENYDWDLGEQLTNGVDVWLNTPRRPYEASGTSGMKAALNGVPSLSVLDGWWIEGCAENVTGWAIDDLDDEKQEAELLYTKLEQTIVPLFKDTRAWAKIRQHCIGINGSFFNTHRMLGQYVANAYFPHASSIAATDQEITVNQETHEPVLV
jgi:starch phosphorylase